MCCGVSRKTGNIWLQFQPQAVIQKSDPCVYTTQAGTSAPVGFNCIRLLHPLREDMGAGGGMWVGE